MFAFLSYAADDRQTAHAIRDLLTKLNIESFLAHEDIGVSEEWRSTLLKRIRKTDMFIAILSQRYFKSVWCVQESGIAVFRGMTIIPLSIDGTIPEGFLAHFQSTKIDPDAPSLVPLLAGAAKLDIKRVIEAIIDIIESSRSFRTAETNFELILPYVARSSKNQIVRLLEVSTANKQICHASRCASEYLPPLLKSHGSHLRAEVRDELQGVLAQYEKPKR
jgi:hypothetical protein